MRCAHVAITAGDHGHRAPQRANPPYGAWEPSFFDPRANDTLAPAQRECRRGTFE